MLLVDDNRINLKLLQTFMKKRKYTNVTNAEDGQEAVNAYSSLLRKSPPEPPDIILMDISMPVMNGFEATRRIREIEAGYREQLPPMHTPPSCLIIALTGLASGRDQSEAFTSGFDLYITKPVSFAEISRLLDNWEANGGVAMADGVPHGAVVAGEGEGEKGGSEEMVRGERETRTQTEKKTTPGLEGPPRSN
ncbi:CheY-like superfamily [Clohesyomyces aquaticus]|uniref:CheY-like superfamily n=1 Tax=Clohesyomyces aquaticus TaxID=1231657 RepID=A0A1Y1ZNX1_9PLEO|nr:CheY-like superfamily [Clohesyomyces aquaticus]